MFRYYDQLPQSDARVHCTTDYYFYYSARTHRTVRTAVRLHSYGRAFSSTV